MPVLTPARAVGGDRPHLDSRAVPPRGPHRAQVHPPVYARGDRDLPRARDPELPAAAADALPLLDQGSRRAAAARRASARARVHHEGRLLVRPRRGRPRRELPKQEEAYHRIFRRCGLEYSAVAAESGVMGGKESMDFLAPSGSGENTLVTCENGDYAADLEIARGIPRPAGLPGAPRRAREGRDARRHDDRGAGGASSASTARRPRRRCPSSRPTARSSSGSSAATTGCRSPSCCGVLGSDFRPATDDEIRAAFGAGGGSLGPVGVDVEVIADDALREGQFVAGANRDGWHLLGVEAGATSTPRSPTSASRSRATRAPSAAARSASRPRSRSGTSSSSATATPRRSTRRSSTRTGRRSR